MALITLIISYDFDDSKRVLVKKNDEGRHTLPAKYYENYNDIEIPLYVLELLPIGYTMSYYTTAREIIRSIDQYDHLQVTIFIEVHGKSSVAAEQYLWLTYNELFEACIVKWYNMSSISKVFGNDKYVTVHDFHDADDNDAIIELSFIAPDYQKRRIILAWLGGLRKFVGMNDILEYLQNVWDKFSARMWTINEEGIFIDENGISLQTLQTTLEKASNEIFCDVIHFAGLYVNNGSTLSMYNEMFDPKNMVNFVPKFTMRIV